MASKSGSKKAPKKVETLVHDDASRTNIPSAEHQSVVGDDIAAAIAVAYERRNRDLDPQLVWRGKDAQDLSDLVVNAPPLYIQERVHPKAIIDDLKRKSNEEAGDDDEQIDLFADFNAVDEDVEKTDFYQHESNWTNRMILGDSLQVMASLAEREGLRGKVQCIYFDPPYGIKFNSNFQWSTTSRDVRDGKIDHITREPEQVKAFRDTWRDGIHSYLTYLRDRLIVARDLLGTSGSIFVQIGDENVHRVRALLDEIFGDENFISEITFKKTGGQSSTAIANVTDIILWYAKESKSLKSRALYFAKRPGDEGATNYAWIDEGGLRRPLRKPEKEGREPVPEEAAIMQPYPMFSDGPSSRDRPFKWRGSEYTPSKNAHWKTHAEGLNRLALADRLLVQGKTLRFVNYLSDYPVSPILNLWTDTQISGFGADRIYVVQTLPKVVERCILMATDPGDLVIDPTCGSGTTATVAEQWGRRWITMDTSRVSLALARSRIMGSRYPFYLLSDSSEGLAKEAELSRAPPASQPTHRNIQRGFVCERVPHITLGSIANNTEIDLIWERFQGDLESLRLQLNEALNENWEEWEVPREALEVWCSAAKALHQRWLDTRTARQKEIDASITAKADFEHLYDKPYEDKNIVRVAGPFTVESLSPHRVLGVDENDELIDSAAESVSGHSDETDFVTMVLANLKTAGVQQAHKEDKIAFRALTPWPGDLICAEGRYVEGGTAEDAPTSGEEKRAAIFVGPEFGTVSRPDLVAAAREAGDAGFDVLIACAFNYDAHSSEFAKLGRVPVLKARMNADLHMADDLKNTGKGNLFVIFGEPDIDILNAENDQIQVKVNGVDVFHPQTGEVQSDGPDGIACWFIDTDYNEEAFFVRQAYFLGANDPYKSLKTTLKAEIDEVAWASLNSDTSRPFNKPSSGRIAVKVINHLGDEVMKVFRPD